MSPYNSDEEDAPESISLSTSKKIASGKRAALLDAHAHEKLKRKEKNREKDRRLKERASSSKRINAGDHLESIEARMERTMQEAQEEEASGSDDLGQLSPHQATMEEGSQTKKIRFSDIEEDLNDDIGDRDEYSNQRTNPNHLPDHVFEAAFAQKSASKPKPALPQPQTRHKKRRSTKQSAKDIVLGSRTIRPLPDESSLTSQRVPHTIPSTKVKKFISKTLNLNGNKSKSRIRGWERRPANVGVMKSTGPAANFVRNN